MPARRSGLRAKDIMARGELVPDDVVVSIVSDRIDEPDASKGFILDGFPRTVPQAHALDRMLKEKGLALDAVIELKVDESILLERIEKRIAETIARGETLRPDDNPEVLRRRLLAYRDQTAPLATYYQLQSVLRTVDGMAPIPDVCERHRCGAAQAAGRRGRQGKPRGNESGRHEKPRSPSLPRAKPSAAKSAAKPVTKPAKGKAAKAAARPAREACEKQAQGRQIGRSDHPRPQGSPRQKHAPAEVDETPLNPLITRIQVEWSNDTGPRGTGRVSRYRLRAFDRNDGRPFCLSRQQE